MFNPLPADLSDREPLFHVASTTEFWYRSHRVGNSPIYFGKSQTHWWDSPDGDFGVLYLGGDEYSAFMDSIGRGALKTRFISSSQLKGTALAKIRFKESLRFIDMVTSGGLTRAHADRVVVVCVHFANWPGNGLLSAFADAVSLWNG